MDILKQDNDIVHAIKNDTESSSAEPEIQIKLASIISTKNGKESVAICASKSISNGRKIIQNMEEVLNSVKKKHKHYHKHKHNKKNKKVVSNSSSTSTKLDPEISDISNIMDTKETEDEIKKKTKRTENCQKKIPNKNQNILETLKSPSKENIRTLTKATRKTNIKKSKSSASKSKLVPPEVAEMSLTDLSSPHKNIDQHFPVTHKKTDIYDEEKTINSNTNTNKKVNNGISITTTDDKNQAKINAFEFMMNARNKSIGMNSPGRDVETKNDLTLTSKEERLKERASRKLLLEEWADKKGANKRKLKDMERGEFIEQELNNRAKRMKKMITSDGKKKKIITSPNDLNNSTIQPKSKAKQRNRRNSSIEILEVPIPTEQPTAATTLEVTNNTNDEIEFVAKLSSPIKKRDNLLGYFPKTISPNNEASEKHTDNVQIENSKKSKSKKKSQQIELSSTTTTINNKIDDGSVDLTPTTTSGVTRPRRSCAGKIRYDLIQSPPKILQTKRKSMKKLATKDDDNLDIIILDSSLDENSCSVNETVTVEKFNTKLAPLFVKSKPKSNIDAQHLAARQAFLMSGVPEKMKKEIEKQKQFLEVYENDFEFFPKISNVPTVILNHSTVTTPDIDWLKCGIKWKKIENIENNIQLLTDNGKLGNITECTIKDFQNLKKKLNHHHQHRIPLLPTLQNKRILVKKWKLLYDKFPTYKCYNQLREKYRYFNAVDSVLQTQQIAESFVVTTKRTQCHPPRGELAKNENDDDDEKPPILAPNGELLFTDKYKPMTSDQVLVNLTPVNLLKDFLSTWQNNSTCNLDLNNSFHQFQQEFNDSNDSLNFSTIYTSNSIVLYGPNSSGKTQAVFALADELNFNVLEINAGMKRTGKKLLQELQEATQSHQVRKEKNTTKKNLLKKSLNHKNQSSLQIFNELDNGQQHSQQNNNEKMSLILVEDADILFESYDAGFIDAIYQLASISKRPVVIISNNPNCQHLMRLMKQNSIEFVLPNAYNIGKFLTILSLIENCPIDLDNIISLYLYNNKDLRKTILEIQFFIQSGGDHQHNKRGKNLKKKSKKLYASPTKHRLSTEVTAEVLKSNDDFCGSNNFHGCEDESLNIHNNQDENQEDDIFYIHKELFEYYTISQNINYLIPYPIDLNVLWSNLSSIFKISKNLSQISSPSSEYKSKNSENTVASATDRAHQQFNNLVEFYENISIASCITSKFIENRSINHIEEDISHNLIENSILTILDATPDTYNIFDESPKSQSTNLLRNIQTTSIISSCKAKYLDYEPNIRAICRSEKSRSLLDRRSSRFYHYLRSNSINSNSFSTEIFDKTCKILVDEYSPSENNNSTCQEETN